VLQGINIPFQDGLVLRRDVGELQPINYPRMATDYDSPGVNLLLAHPKDNFHFG